MKDQDKKCPYCNGTGVSWYDGGKCPDCWKDIPKERDKYKEKAEQMEQDIKGLLCALDVVAIEELQEDPASGTPIYYSCLFCDQEADMGDIIEHNKYCPFHKYGFYKEGK